MVSFGSFFLLYDLLSEAKLSNIDNMQNIRLQENGLESDTAPLQRFCSIEGVENTGEGNTVSRNSPWRGKGLLLQE